MNRGSDSVLSVYSDARAEYTKQLCMFLVPAYFQFYIELLEKAKQSMSAEPKRILWQFQTYLNEIHDWNMEKVNHEINTIYTNCGCDYMEDLLTAVFVAHTKVLTAIRLSANNKKVEINVPKVEHFLFKVLCETAKLLWSSTYLFRDGIPGMERQQNYRNIEQILNEGILQAVRNLVPVKSILKDFMNQDVSADAHEAADAADDDDSDDEEKEKEKEKEKEPVKAENEMIIPNAISLSSDIPIIAETKDVPQVELKEVPMEEPKEEPTNEANPIIMINEKPAVTFGKYNTIFSTEHPEESDMIIDVRDDESHDGDHIPALEIMEESGQPLDEIDFDTLDGSVESIDVGDYEEL